MKRAKPTKGRTKILTIKLSAEERDLLEDAAGEYPISTWSRVKLLEAARSGGQGMPTHYLAGRHEVSDPEHPGEMLRQYTFRPYRRRLPTGERTRKGVKENFWKEKRRQSTNPRGKGH